MEATVSQPTTPFNKTKGLTWALAILAAVAALFQRQQILLGAGATYELPFVGDVSLGQILTALVPALLAYVTKGYEGGLSGLVKDLVGKLGTVIADAINRRKTDVPKDGGLVPNSDVVLDLDKLGVAALLGYLNGRCVGDDESTALVNQLFRRLVTDKQPEA
jgi:hypothetical protein